MQYALWHSKRRIKKHENIIKTIENQRHNYFSMKNQVFQRKSMKKTIKTIENQRNN